MIVTQRQLALRGHRAVLPQALDRLVVNPVPRRAKEHPGQCTILKPHVERFEPGDLFQHHGGGTRAAWSLGATATSSRRSPSIPCCWKRRRSFRTVSGGCGFPPLVAWPGDLRREPRGG